MKLELDRNIATETAPPPQAVCGFTADDYAQVLWDLLPRGWAWTREPESVLMRVFAGLAVEFARVHGRDCDLLAEAYPGTAIETLPDWERVLGLPDECLPASDTIQARRAAILAKLAMRGGADPAYFIQVAAALGVDITITEFHPFRVSQSRVGQHLWDEDWPHVWRVNIPGQEQIVYFRAGQSTASDPLRYWASGVIECVLSRIKPAHTVLLFGYEEEVPAGDWDDQQSSWDSELPGGPSRWDVGVTP